MKIFKFYNETYGFNLHFLIYDYRDENQYKRLVDILTKHGSTKAEIRNSLSNSDGFFVGGDPYLLIIDINEFDLTDYKGIVDLLRVIQHECGHVRGQVLRDIGEKAKTTDSECYLKISDWAFKKCLGTLFVKCLLKLQPKKKVSKQ